MKRKQHCCLLRQQIIFEAFSRAQSSVANFHERWKFDTSDYDVFGPLNRFSLTLITASDTVRASTNFSTRRHRLTNSECVFLLLLVPQLTQNNWKRSTRTWRSRQWLGRTTMSFSETKKQKKNLFPAKCDKVLFPPISAQCLFANLISSSFVCRRKSGKLFPIRRRRAKKNNSKLKFKTPVSDGV